MQLLPEGSLRRRVFEATDRWLSGLFFGNSKTMSTNCGDRLKAGTAGIGCKCLCKGLDAVERDHCIKNAGKT